MNSTDELKQKKTIHPYTLIACGSIFAIICSAFIFNLNKSETISLINAAASVILSIVALYCIDSWKKQGTWEKEVKSAIELSTLFYRSKDALKLIASPLTSGKQITNDKDYEENLAKQIHKHKIDATNSFHDLFLEIEVKKYEFEVILGTDASKIASRILDLRRKLIQNIDMYPEYARMHSKAIANAKETEGLQLNGQPTSAQYLAHADDMEKAKKSIEDIIFCRANSPIPEELADLETELNKIQAKFALPPAAKITCRP